MSESDHGAWLLKQLLPLAPQVGLAVEVEEKDDETEGVQEHSEVEPIGERALSEEIVGGVSSNESKLALGKDERDRSIMVRCSSWTLHFRGDFPSSAQKTGERGTLRVSGC